MKKTFNNIHVCVNDISTNKYVLSRCLFNDSFIDLKNRSNRTHFVNSEFVKSKISNANTTCDLTFNTSILNDTNITETSIDDIFFKNTIMYNIFIDKIYGNNTSFINNSGQSININDCIFNKIIISDNIGDINISNSLIKYLHINNDYDDDTPEEYIINNSIIDTLFVDNQYTVFTNNTLHNNTFNNPKNNKKKVLLNNSIIQKINTYDFNN